MPRPTALLILSLLLLLFSVVLNLPCKANAADITNDDNDNDDGVDDDADLEPEPFEDAYEVLTQSVDQRSYNPADPDQRTYAVIVDCGSSGTRAHLYEWDSSLQFPQLLQDIVPMRSKQDNKPLSRKFRPSLSSFADAPPEVIERYIKQVLDYIESIVPRRKHPFTGVYMLATAGMRLLSDQNQDRIMKIICAYIDRNYTFAKVKTSVITGADEGMYQWISVNSKSKRFLRPDTQGRTKTYAVVEMGGASIQVTYQLRKGVKEVMMGMLSSDEAWEAFEGQIVRPELSRKEIIEHNYELLSATFLGFGSNSAREAYLDLLIHKHINDNWLKSFNWLSKRIRSYFGPAVNQDTSDSQQLLVLNDPCLPRGFSSDNLKKPREILNAKRRILGYLADDDEPTVSIKLHGTGNYNKCKRLVEEMLKLAKQERFNCKEGDTKCTMSLIGEPIINFDSLDVLGIGDIFYTVNLMLNEGGLYNHRSVAKKTKDVCNTSYSTLKKHHSDIYDDPSLRSRLADECFKAIWVDTFLVKGLLMPTSYKTLRTKGDINGDDLEWTLGAVLDKSLAIETATEEMSVKMMQSASEKEQQGEHQTVVEPTTVSGEAEKNLLLSKTDDLLIHNTIDV